MKVYVDELPKDCWDCPMHDGENGWCKMLVCYTDYIPKDCPLQSLADHDKQVRKEVCEEIQSELLDFTHKYWRVFKQNGKQYMTDDDLVECLNEIISQIQGETK